MSQENRVQELREELSEMAARHKDERASDARDRREMAARFFTLVDLLRRLRDSMAVIPWSQRAPANDAYIKLIDEALLAAAPHMGSGYALWLSREEWGCIMAGLVVEMVRSGQRSLPERVQLCKRLLREIETTALRPPEALPIGLLDAGVAPGGQVGPCPQEPKNESKTRF